MHQTKEGADLVYEAPKHDPFIKWAREVAGPFEKSGSPLS